jgi:hypothetical protein
MNDKLEIETGELELNNSFGVNVDQRLLIFNVFLS